MTKLIFIPPSWDSTRYREHFTAEAEARGVEVVFLGAPVTPDDLANSKRLIIAQSVSAEIAPLVDDSWVVLHIENPQGVVDLFHTMHPEEGVRWAATHGSAGLAMSAWLLELGARPHRAHDLLSWADLDLPGTDEPGAPPTTSPLPDNPLTFYTGVSIPKDKAWTWAPGMLDGDDPSALAAARWIDITGSAHHIINGPYIFLPAGRWKATLTVSIDIESSNPTFVCQWGGAAHETSVCEVNIRHSGHYEITIESQLAWPDAVRFLFASKTALFSGRVRIGDLRIQREQEDSPKAPTVSRLSVA